ncbi:hypothetical protein ACF0H5_006285 [Mactra antiquata]
MCKHEIYYIISRDQVVGEMDVADEDFITRRNREQEKLRRQHERLENEKRLHKEQSYIKRERRRSLPSDEIILDIASKSKHRAPNTKKVKSRLFDFEKSAPRSRLQLQEDSNCSSPTSSACRVPMATHAMEGTKMTHSEIVNNIAVVPSIQREKIDVNDNTLLAKTDLEKQATMRRSSLSVEQKEAGHIAGRRSSINVGHKVSAHFKKSSTESFLHPNDAIHRSRTPSPSTSGINQTRKLSVDTSEANDARLQELYNKAIETVQMVDESLLSAEDHPSAMQYKIKSKRRHSDGVQTEKPINTSGFDLATLRELESILSDARTYSNRRGSSEDHVRLDLGSNRAQKKRIQHLEDVLKRLNPNYDEHKTVLDPAQILQCRYLRLSKSNVESLENMLKEQGKDVGIHVHSDVSNTDIWQGMKEERTDLKHLEKETKTKT